MLVTCSSNARKMDETEMYVLGRLSFQGEETPWSLLKYAGKESAHCEINTSLVLAKFNPALGKF